MSLCAANQILKNKTANTNTPLKARKPEATRWYSHRQEYPQQKPNP